MKFKMSDRVALKSGLTLAVIAGVCTLLVVLTWLLTEKRIEANKTAWLERSLQPALSGLFFEGSVTESMLTIPAPHTLPGSEAAIVYRVYAANEPVAALFVVTARDGYAGPIRLLIGIAMDGTVTGVRVLEHRETPGLGDRVESTKSDWVLQFDGKSLQNPVDNAWAIQRDGGNFDQLTGASVTPRAIVKAIKETLIYFDSHRDSVFESTNVDAATEGEE